MKSFVYIITDNNRNSLHVGMCTDLLKTLKFYTELPGLFFDETQKLNRLVYYEEAKSEEIGIQRFKIISNFTRTQKEQIIRSINPNWNNLESDLISNPVYRVTSIN